MNLRVSLGLAVLLAAGLLAGPALAAAPVHARAAATIAMHGREDSRCLLRVLEELGWQLELQAGSRFELQPGTPCDRADLMSAQAAGDLQLRMDPLALEPDAPHAATQRHELQALLAHPATLCAFAIQLGAATRRATTRLAANHGYRFSALQMGWIGFGMGGARADGWKRIRSFGRGYVPADGNWRAIEGFYSGRVRSECGVGRQIAQYAAIAELFGPDAFDAGFDADEIVIGTFRQLHGTRSILLGSQAGTLLPDGLGRRAAAMGRQGFSGLPGFIVHSFDASHLDDIHNQAQNFVVHEVSAEAARLLKESDGFAPFNARNRDIWERSRQIAAPGRRGFERLLIDREARAIERLSADERARLEQMQQLLDSPFYREFEIYVHPMGIRPVGYHIVRLLDRNPRTPFQIELALHNLHTTLYERFLTQRLASCAEPGHSRPAPVH
jgi:hypothetical protein